MSKTKQESGIFTYTTRRGSYISTISALLFLMVGEVGLLVFLIVKFVPLALLKLGLSGALVLFFLFIVGRLLTPLWTKHRLSERELHLRFGFDFNATIQRNTILSAQAARERVVLPAARYESEKQRVTIPFSDDGQILLKLDQPYPFRLGLTKRVFAEQILFSVDAREELLMTLNPDVRGGPQDAHQGRPYISDGLNPTSLPAHVSITVNTGGGADSTYVGTPLVGVRQPPLHSIPAILTKHLTRRYNDFTAVDDLNLSIQPGEIYGFLGANGAGKTTTIKMLAGLLQPHAGRAEIAGHDVWKEPLAAKVALGYVADRALLYERLTGREFLAFLAQMRGLPRAESESRIEQLLALLDLHERAHSPCGSYSFGMKRKLALAGALLHQPAVLILDEPLNGLDPLSARRLKDLFLELAARGTSIFLSTHDLATAESICHRVGIIARGCMLIEGSAAELRDLLAAPDLETVFLSLTAPGGEVPA